jgi:hypothetical protein
MHARVRARLTRLERKAIAHVAYRGGTGERPCPPWIDSGQWASRGRLGVLLIQRARVDPAGQAEPPGTTDEERRWVESVWATFTASQPCLQGRAGA